MIVCSCNVLSDAEVRTVANTATRRTTSYVYSCLGCRARCGRCARNIREIMDEVFDGAKVVTRMAAPYSLRPRTSSPRLQWCRHPVASRAGAAGKFRVNFLESEPWPRQERGYEG